MKIFNTWKKWTNNMSIYIYLFTTGIKPECEMKTNTLQSHAASVSMMLQEHIFIILYHFLVSKSFLFIMPSAWYGPRAACAKANGAVQWLVHWCGLYNVQFAGNVSFPDLQNNYQSAGNPSWAASRALISFFHPKCYERNFGRYLTSFVDLHWTSCTKQTRYVPASE